MRRLSLLRHAKSDWGDPSIDDFYRPLNGRGKKAAQAMGRYLLEQGVKFDLVVASPAARVVETLKGLGKSGWQSGVVRYEQSIYGATTRELIDFIRSIGDDMQNVLLVGHNPTMANLVAQLAREDEAGLRSSVVAKYPTGALAELELDVDSWSAVEPACSQLTRFVTPRTLLQD